MTSLRKLRRDHTAADMAAVEAMLNRLTDEDVMMRMSLEGRRAELVGELASLPAGGETLASAAMFFGGRPVIGGRGIESEFAGKAASIFQDLVAKQTAEETSGLAQRGVVANKSATRLHITDVVRGSFGFLFEELEPNAPLIDTSLKVAVDHVSSLLSAFAEVDEAQFETAVESVDARVLATAEQFFSLMRQEGATLRMIAGEFDRTFDTASVERAAERAKVTTVVDKEDRIPGQLAGVLPDGHMFEFRSADARGTIRGKVDKAIPSVEAAAMNTKWLNKPIIATMAVRQVIKDGQVVRESFTLRSLAEASDPTKETERLA